MVEKKRTTKKTTPPAGAIALVGAWGDIDDAEIDAFIAGIYAARSRDLGRPVRLED